MKYRKLRIAWSVAGCMLCLLLITLWMQSYSQHSYLIVKVKDRLPAASQTSARFSHRQLWCESWSGQLSFSASLTTDSKPPAVLIFSSKNGASVNDLFERRSYEKVPELMARTGIYAFRYQSSDKLPAELWLFMPHWLATAFTAILAAACWLPWPRLQFSLKTTLIMISVISALLGIMAYSLRG